MCCGMDITWALGFSDGPHQTILWCGSDCANTTHLVCFPKRNKLLSQLLWQTAFLLSAFQLFLWVNIMNIFCCTAAADINTSVPGVASLTSGSLRVKESVWCSPTIPGLLLRLIKSDMCSQMGLFIVISNFTSENWNQIGSLFIQLTIKSYISSLNQIILGFFKIQIRFGGSLKPNVNNIVSDALESECFGLSSQISEKVRCLSFSCTTCIVSKLSTIIKKSQPTNELPLISVATMQIGQLWMDRTVSIKNIRIILCTYTVICYNSPWKVK